MIYMKVDIENVLPDKIEGVTFTKEVKNNLVKINGKYDNGRKFSLNMKRFIDPLFFGYCIGLFGGEGTKTKEKARTRFEFTNSNPNKIKSIIKFVKAMGIEEDKIKIRLQYSSSKKVTEDLISKVTKFWIKSLKLKKKNFVTPSIHMKSGDSKFMGTISIRVNNTFLSRLTNHWDSVFFYTQFPNRRKSKSSPTTSIGRGLGSPKITLN